jgi:hypothetical protein
VIELSTWASSSTTPLRLPDDQATPFTVRLSEANPKGAMRLWRVSRGPDGQKGGYADGPSRVDRSEEYMEKLLLSPEEAAEAGGPIPRL